MKVLVTGGVRSGKSFHAESLVFASDTVTYVAPGPTPDSEGDPDWSARISAHQDRRPAHWRTVESADLVEALADGDDPVLVDCLGTWLTAQIDELDGWDALVEEWQPVLLERLDAVADAVTSSARDVVLVTNEVGLGVVPEHRSGRLFRDLLGIVNQRLAEEVDEVHLVIAGRVLKL